MASVTFSSSVGGDNSTVTDDTNATTGLANGGHRLRFVPALAQLVAVASYVVTQATNASTSASTASTQAGNASTSATNANNSFLSIDTKYLGAKSGDPTLNNQGGALTAGALYWSTTGTKFRVYTGSVWTDVVASTTFTDNNFLIQDNLDGTKKVAFEVSGVGAGTTVTLTVPNASGTILTSASGMAPLSNPTFTGIVGIVGATTALEMGRVDGTASSPFIDFHSGATATDFDARIAASGGNGTSGNGTLTFYGGTYNFTTGGISAPSVTTSAATGFTLNNATSNLILFPAVGVNAPTFTTRSVGTKIALYNAVSASSADFALGIESSTMWLGVPTTAYQFKFYGGTTQAALLTGTGNLTLAGTLTSIKTDIGTTNPAEVLVGTGGDNIVKKQTLANFVNSLDNSMVVNQPTTNTTMVAGKVYQDYPGDGAITLIMPTRASSIMGHTIVIECLRYPDTSFVGWETNNLTITVPADVNIGTFGLGVTVTVDMPKLDRITLRCTFVNGLYATWAIGLGG